MENPHLARIAARLLVRPVFPGTDSPILYEQVATLREIAHKLGLSELTVAVILDHDEYQPLVPKRRRGRLPKGWTRETEEEAQRQTALLHQYVRINFRVAALNRIVRNIDKTGLPVQYSTADAIRAADEILQLARLHDIDADADAIA